MICYLVNGIHFIYIAVTYIIIPYAFGEWKLLQFINLLNISILIAHWWALNNNCILDLLAQKHCPNTTYNKFNTRGIGIDDVTFTNVIQVFLASAIVIAIATLIREPIAFSVRCVMLFINLLIVLYIVRITRIHHLLDKPE